ncbi:MAG: nucleotide exchange factor GrpE [Chloroflexi bacterium RBG_16_54_18]|nr:MAG: nucleotide exchange factor GrpE [Chloroflexi bacterium RBG_16_54_18]
MAKKDTGKAQQAEPSQVSDRPAESSTADQETFDSDQAAKEEEALQREIEMLRQQLAGQQAKAEEYLDGWQRARAEFANYKKRVEREQSQAYQMAAGSILKRYLELTDDLERALKNRPTEGEGQAWASGIELIYSKLLTFLENEGVKQFQAEGQSFDPNYHEAVTSEESDQHSSGQIIEVLQQGYLLGERVLRPAMVRVAR